MSKDLVFSIDRTHLEGKQGKLPKDKDGFYEMLCGAYNVPNSVGERYVFTDEVKKLFVDSTAVRKLKLNQLYSERNHPQLDYYRAKTRTETEAVALWMRRLAFIDMNNLACQIGGIRWSKLDKRVNGRDVYGVFLKLKPIFEPMIQQVNDPDQNTAMSVRSFIERRYQLGEFLCITKDLISWDWIAHGGIALATKYNTPGLEAENIINTSPEIYAGENACIQTSDRTIITTHLLEHMEELELASSNMGVGVENNVLFNTMMIRGVSGWREVPDLGALASRNW